MQKENRPESPVNAPDPARVYERAKPEAESGMGRMDNDDLTAVPADHPDHAKDAVSHAQPSRQLNADNIVNNRATGTP